MKNARGLLSTRNHTPLSQQSPASLHILFFYTEALGFRIRFKLIKTYNHEQAQNSPIVFLTRY